MLVHAICLIKIKAGMEEICKGNQYLFDGDHVE